MIYRSDHPLPEVPSALIDASTGETLTFADLVRSADAAAAGLAAAGLQPGDVVGPSSSPRTGSPRTS